MRSANAGAETASTAKKYVARKKETWHDYSLFFNPDTRQLKKNLELE